jgi:hypothetical protein
MICCPQLFVAGPHDLSAQAAVLSGVQQVPSPWQTPALGHVAGQVTCWPQLLVTVTLHLPAQGVALSGVQHAPLSQTWSDVAQLIVPPLPQATD